MTTSFSIKKLGRYKLPFTSKKKSSTPQERRDFIFNTLLPTIKEFEQQNNVDVRISGMPYIRTLNAQNIQDEIALFVVGALGITAVIFLLFLSIF